MLTDPPGADEIEVSIFGPGKGESIAVHLGHGDWIVVDSCIDQVDKSIPVLDYFDRLGVDVASRVRLVVGTHAHDDHIAGISNVFEKATSAYFVSSSALVSEEFFALMHEEEQSAQGLRQSSYSEYRAIAELVKSRGTRGRGHISHRRAIENRVILRIPAEEEGG